MTPLQKEMYDLIVKNFGDPQKIRYMKVRVSRKLLLANFDHALATWAMELRHNNKVSAAEALQIHRNKLRNMLNVFKPIKDPVTTFMDGLRVDNKTIAP